MFRLHISFNEILIFFWKSCLKNSLKIHLFPRSITNFIKRKQQRIETKYPSIDFIANLMENFKQRSVSKRNRITREKESVSFLADWIKKTTIVEAFRWMRYRVQEKVSRSFACTPRVSFNKLSVLAIWIKKKNTFFLSESDRTAKWLVI